MENQNFQNREQLKIGTKKNSGKETKDELLESLKISVLWFFLFSFIKLGWISRHKSSSESEVLARFVRTRVFCGSFDVYCNGFYWKFSVDTMVTHTQLRERRESLLKRQMDSVDVGLETMFANRRQCKEWLIKKLNWPLKNHWQQKMRSLNANSVERLW